MKKLWIVLLLTIAGCGLMKSLGLSDEAGQPTPTAESLDAVVKGMSGFSILALWKAGEALFTSRGRDNLKNVFSKTGFVSTLQSIMAVLFGSHTPTDAKATTK